MVQEQAAGDQKDRTGSPSETKAPFSLQTLTFQAASIFPRQKQGMGDEWASEKAKEGGRTCKAEDATFY